MKFISLIAASLFVAVMANAQDVNLPEPASSVGVDLLSGIHNRSVSRAFVEKPLPLKELSTILAAGIGKRGTDAVASATKSDRTVSFSGDNAYINVYVLDSKGTYAYEPNQNRLSLRTAGDSRKNLTPEAIPNSAFIVLYTINNALIPPFLKGSPAMFQLMGHSTAGFAAQNVALVASAYRLSSIVMYNLKPAAAQSAARLSGDEVPLFIQQIGFAK